MLGRALHPQRPDRTIEDIGALTRTATKRTSSATPAKACATIAAPDGRDRPFATTPKPKRQYDALELGYNRRFSNNWFFSANYTFSRLYGNYAGLASSDEITTPTTGVSSATAQQQAGNISRQGGNANRAWDLDELLWDSHGNLDVLGRLATDRPHVVKLYGAYDFPFGTQVGAFFYGGSGTPISTYVNTVNADPSVRRTAAATWAARRCCTQTDLLLSHELAVTGSSRLRFELNVLNVFNQKTATHIFNYLNRARASARAVVGHRPGQHRPGEGLRLQRADPSDARRRQRLRSALRHGRPVPDRARRVSSA